MRRIRALARLIILDGLRRHALIGLVLFALAGSTGGLFFFDFIPRDIGRATNDFLFSVTWVTGFIFLLFHAVQVMAWDTERGALHTFLARPISRTEYGLALYAGLAVLLLALNVILGVLGWGVLNIIRGSVDAASYFQHLSLPFFLLAGAGLFWIQMVILAVILLFSSVMRGSFPVLLLTLCYYFICFGLPVVRESIKQKPGTTTQFLDSMLKWLTAIFPDFSWLDFKTLAASSDAVPVATQLTLPFALATLYIVIVLWLACAIYERRDLQ
jgi:hypothetical protein